MKSFFDTIFWILKKTIFGFVIFYAFNFIGSYLGIGLIPNFISYFVIGSLGFPGLVVVYMLNILLA